MCAIGLVFAALFHIFVQEPDQTAKPRRVRPSVYTIDTKKYLQHTRGSLGIITLLANSKDKAVAPSSKKTSLSYLDDPEEFERRLKGSDVLEKKWYYWFRSFSFWKITLMYTLARMLSNVTQVYTTLYLQYYLNLPKVGSCLPQVHSPDSSPPSSVQ